MIKTGILGNRGEKLALKFLTKQQFKLQEKNFHCRFGEIDLIMWDQSYLVFIEVRYRKSNDYGGALESINQSKQDKLRRSAEFYLSKTNNHNTPCRFDILCLDGEINKPNYQWIKNAF
ncbi:MAG: YraN family protein [Acidiferrobacterales bacterium]|nr:YraN family protein [Acidiferrobacterales bacterium]